MRLIDANMLKNTFKVHYDLFVSAYENEQDMSLADKSRVDEILNSMAEVINAPTVFDTDNATNGDVIKAMFPDGNQRAHEPMIDYSFGEYCYEFSLEWWNSLYSEGR